MVRRLLIVLVAVLGLAACEPSAPRAPTAPLLAPPTGFVHRNGQTLVGGDSGPLVLHGWNLGGWLNWESFIFLHGSGYWSEQQMMTNLATVVGPERADRFRADVRAAFIDADDLTAIAAAGFNHVRLPINWRALEDPAGWQLLDQAIGWARDAGLYVVLDLHSAPCGQSNEWHADPETVPSPFWTSPGCRARTADLWRTIAARYATSTTVAGYDLLNEPPDVPGPTALAVFTELVAAVRAVDPNHLIIVEGTKVTRDFGWLAAPLDPNMALSFHDYDWLPWEGFDVRVQRDYRPTLDRLGLPGYLGEFGLVSRPDSIGFYRRWASNLPGVGSAQWTWKADAAHKVPNLIPVGFTHTAASRALMRWLAADPAENNWPRPTVDQAEQGMADFLTAVTAAI